MIHPCADVRIIHAFTQTHSTCHVALSIWVAAVVKTILEFAIFAEIPRVTNTARYGKFDGAPPVERTIVFAILGTAILPDKGGSAHGVPPAIALPVFPAQALVP